MIILIICFDNLSNEKIRYTVYACDKKNKQKNEKGNIRGKSTFGNHQVHKRHHPQPPKKNYRRKSTNMQANLTDCKRTLIR